MATLFDHRNPFVPRIQGANALFGRKALELRIKLRVDQERILPDFLHMLLNAPQTRLPIERNARSTSGVHNINSGEAKAISVELPPIDEQRQIMTAADDAFQKIVDLENWCDTELKRSAFLRQSILKDAFAGRLVPQDPADEPASALLARIAKAKKPTKRPAESCRHE